MENRIILHIDMDAFFAQIEERENPQFRGKPVVVGADPALEQVRYGAGPKGEPIIKMRATGRGVVSTANYEARKYGIHSALPISKAFELCPKAIFLPVNIELYKKVSEKIMKIIKKYSPKFEIVSLDEAYLDLSFLIPKVSKANSNKKTKLTTDIEAGYWEAENLAKRLKKKIFEKERLTSTIGIGPNKTIAKMATNEAKPDGLLTIRPDQVEKFLNPLDIEKLPGIGPKTGMRIAQSLSLRSRRYANAPIRIKDLKKLTRKELIDLFGKVGLTIYERARGIDEEPVTSEEIIKSIGKEHTFERDTRDPEIIFSTFEKIINGVHQELLENKFFFKTITVICRYSGFETHTKSKTLKIPTNDLEILKKEAKKLLLKFLIEKPKLIRLIGVRISNLI